MSAYTKGDERNCRRCNQPIYFGGASWWHKHNESTYCFKTGPNMDRAVPDLDEVERVRAHAPELLEALKEANEETKLYEGHPGRWAELIAKAEAL